jgi:ankyrin repeat protein
MRAIKERAGPATVRALLEQGAYVDQIDQHGVWPLSLAAHEGHAEVASSRLL